MQFPPTASQLLIAVGRLLEGEVLTSVPSHLQHSVRVAGHLVQLVARELDEGAEAVSHERTLLASLLGAEVEDPAAELAERLRRGDDSELERRAWPVLVEIATQDVAVAKPGHDSWTGE